MAEMISRGDDAALIVGAGLAGLFLALRLAPRRALVLSPAPLGEGAASAWAQGGMAVAMGADDSAELHAADTIAAGAGLVDPMVALLLAEEGPARVADLIALGVPFDKTETGVLRQSLEAAHSRARIARVSGDLAGRAIMDALIAAAKAAPHIEIIEGAAARALLLDEHGAVRGALARRRDGALVEIHASHTVIATGGVGGLYRVTTNPPSAVGHGLAMAAHAGAAIGDPEFVQFHPTAIDVGRDPAPLATEALRGEGAKLVSADGAPFMAAYDPRAELAPRDVVARAIHRQRLTGKGAYLDARSAIGAHFPEAFPTVFAACIEAGIDPRTDLIPVAPAAHYHMGGIVSDLSGKSSVARLSVVGECASTGAHGANRLASNSLLESVVFAARIAEDLRHADTANGARPAPAPPIPELPADARTQLRTLMDLELGVERSEPGLSAARAQIANWAESFGACNELIAAGLIVEGARARRASVGAHYRRDFPQVDPGVRTFLTRVDLPWRAFWPARERAMA
jgi:L-aspartate oxidase